jgi:fumarylpyruvate hydrolase
MNEKKTESRRSFLTGSAAAAGATVLGAKFAPVAAQERGYVLDVPPVISMEINGTSDRFPVNRVYCLGRNYAAHAVESGDDPDVNPPFFFIKPRNAVVDYREGFPYPPMTSALRYEGEMVVALKSGGSNIDPADALDLVYGYGVGLDMTRQDLQQEAQRLSRPWAISKSFDKSAPVGPLTRVSDNGHAVTGRIWLSANGEIKQDSDLALQRWSVAEGISILSKYYELKAGDIILSGTPEGIGLVVKGDVLRVGIEGLGEIEVDVT